MTEGKSKVRGRGRPDKCTICFKLTLVTEWRNSTHPSSELVDSELVFLVHDYFAPLLLRALALDSYVLIPSDEGLSSG